MRIFPSYATSLGFYTAWDNIPRGFESRKIDYNDDDDDDSINSLSNQYGQNFVRQKVQRDQLKE